MMPLPKPEPGLVICYSYLWYWQHADGQESGIKDRPCVVVSAFPRPDKTIRVVVIPTTTKKPSDASFSAVAVPNETKKRLGLRNEPMWFICNEANEFDWTGPDIRPIPNVSPRRYEYGYIGQRLFDAIKNKFLFIAEGKKLKVAHRTE